ncbi:MAG: NAD-dependent dehydratase, partial [Alphaproteobacteria bacterium]
FEISIGDTAALIAEAMGIEIEIEEDPDRLRPPASEVERLFASTERMRGLTDWRPTYGGRDGFVRGVAATAEWFGDPANLARYRHDIYNV